MSNLSQFPLFPASFSEQIETRLCNQCREIKTADKFYRLKKNSKLKQPCIECHKANEKTPERRAYHSTWNKRNAVRLKDEVVAAYGGVCACCDESNSDFLCIDHIENDGAADRKKGLFGIHLYKYLKRNNFPKDRYQLLCFNCNQAKHIYGVCPHIFENIPIN